MTDAHVADMETITAARGWYAAQAMFSVEDRDAVWNRYWQGLPAAPVKLPAWGHPEGQVVPPPPPIWEVLLDGRVEILSE